MYADVFTLPDKDGESIFYLDTSHFVQEDVAELLPYAGASIVRNYVTAYIDIHNNDKSDVVKVLDEFTMEKYLSIEPQILHKFIKAPGFEDGNWIERGKRMVADYMTKSYDQSRQQYYHLIDQAETVLIQIRNHIDNLSTPYLKQTLSEPLPKELIKTMYKAASHALIYRAEGYVCASTIMHVVKTLQEHPDSKKRRNPWPKCKFPTLIAECGIGPWGYLLSMLEQQGYMYRFEIEYCKKEKDASFTQQPTSSVHENKEKCIKKRDKYMFRFLDAKKRMLHYQRRPTQRSRDRGGVFLQKRRMNRRSHRQHK